MMRETPLKTNAPDEIRDTQGNKMEDANIPREEQPPEELTPFERFERLAKVLFGADKREAKSGPKKAKASASRERRA